MGGVGETTHTLVQRLIIFAQGVPQALSAGYVKEVATGVYEETPFGRSLLADSTLPTLSVPITQLKDGAVRE